MTIIRKFRTEDQDAVIRVCLGETSGSGMQDFRFREAVEIVFCRYYIEQENDHCFVAVNDDHQVQGYILCAPDFKNWERLFREQYMERTDNPVVSLMGEGTLNAMRPYADEYPAHLHIDLKPSAQGQGTGRKLMETLCEHIRELNIPGLMLNVSNDNSDAIRFYEKCGFVVLGRSEQETAMGMKLG